MREGSNNNEPETTGPATAHGTDNATTPESREKNHTSLANQCEPHFAAEASDGTDLLRHTACHGEQE